MVALRPKPAGPVLNQAGATTPKCELGSDRQAPDDAVVDLLRLAEQIDAVQELPDYFIPTPEREALWAAIRAAVPRPA